MNEGKMARLREYLDKINAELKAVPNYEDSNELRTISPTDVGFIEYFCVVARLIEINQDPIRVKKVMELMMEEYEKVVLCYKNISNAHFCADFVAVQGSADLRW